MGLIRGGRDGGRGVWVREGVGRKEVKKNWTSGINMKMFQRQGAILEIGLEESIWRREKVKGLYRDL